MSPCDICLDEQCGGKKNCNCSTCKVKDSCPKKLRPTIRITTKCTQKCGHCCFSCSPKRTDMMSIDTSKMIGQFLKSNDIQSANLMGGEFYCNPDWFEIFTNFMEIGGLHHVRIVTNSDWVSSKETTEKVIEFGRKFRVYYALTIDQWHTNKYVKEAQEILDLHKISYQLGNHENDEKDVMENSIVPIGNAVFTFGLYSMFATYCHNQDSKYQFMIDEKGVIFKCPFGIWDFADVYDYVNGGFEKPFKDFNVKFYKCMIFNCKQCINAWNLAEREENEEE